MNNIVIIILNLVLFSVIHYVLKINAFKLKIIDYPDHRKIHKNAVPLSGGISILLPVYICNLFLDTSPIINLIFNS